MPKQFDLTGTRTTAAEVSRNFGHWQDIAVTQPVLVTHHGRPRVVILSSDEYFRLRFRQDTASEATAHDPGLDGVSTLTAHMLEGFAWLDSDLRVRAVNSITAANMGLDVEAALTLDFREIAKTNEGVATFVSWLRRVKRTSQPLRFEMAGITDAARTYSVCAFPFRGGVAYTSWQETETRELRRLAGHWRAELDAINELYEIATLRVNLMGFIEDPNDFLCDLLGFSKIDLAHRRLVDLVVEADRAEVSMSLLALISGASAKFTGVISLMMKTSGSARLKMSCTPIRQDGVCAAVSVVAIEI